MLVVMVNLQPLTSRKKCVCYLYYSLWYQLVYVSLHSQAQLKKQPECDKWLCSCMKQTVTAQKHQCVHYNVIMLRGHVMQVFNLIRTPSDRCSESRATEVHGYNHDYWSWPTRSTFTKSTPTKSTSHNTVYTCYQAHISYKCTFAYKRISFCCHKYSLLSAYRL